jgi:hypothetical protein
MKQKTQKQKSLLLLCSLFMGIAVQSHAQTADYMYVYASAGTRQSFSLDDVQKITFTEQTMQVHSPSGSAASILYDNIKKLTFTSQEGNDIVTPSSSGVKVYLDDAANEVIIESPVEITAVNLFNRQGTLLLYIALRSTSATVSLSARPSGVYIVQVSNGQGVYVHKILKR